MRRSEISLLVGLLALTACQGPGEYIYERTRTQATDICTELGDAASRPRCIDSFIGALDEYDDLEWNIEDATKACKAKGLKLGTQKMWRCTLSRAVDISRM